MPQAGFHGIVGAVARKWMPTGEWLFLGVVLGNIFPDLDNIAVAIATLTHASTVGLHRTFTHSLFTVVVLVIVFYLVAALTKQDKWRTFGLGFGSGILMHIALDLLAWFNGVELFWPINYELNFWSWFTVPDWLSKLLNTGEFLAFGLFFLFLGMLAARQKTDETFLPKLRLWAYLQLGLFVVFTVLAFVMQAGFMTIYGAIYLLSLFLAIGITLRMRRTLETLV